MLATSLVILYNPAMISIPTREHNTEGIADLSEAIDIAQRYGIANAEGAIAQDVCYEFQSLVGMVAMNLTDALPGLAESHYVGSVATHRLHPRERLPSLTNLLSGVQSRVLEAADDRLPSWDPVNSVFGSRMVTMVGNGARFYEHTDVYEGLVVSAQVAVDGIKRMHTTVDGEDLEFTLKQGDITLFACDSFGDVSRMPHGFNFNGLAAISLLLGQDPTYTISGNLPMLEENPQYALGVRQILDQEHRKTNFLDHRY